MFIIVDNLGIIRDSATVRENLSRGYRFNDPSVIMVSRDLVFNIGDEYDKGTIKYRPENHVGAEEREAESLIQAEMRAMAVERLKARFGRSFGDKTEEKAGEIK